MSLKVLRKSNAILTLLLISNWLHPGHVIPQRCLTCVELFTFILALMLYQCAFRTQRDTITTVLQAILSHRLSVSIS